MSNQSCAKKGTKTSSKLAETKGFSFQVIRKMYTHVEQVIKTSILPLNKKGIKRLNGAINKVLLKKKIDLN